MLLRNSIIRISVAKNIISRAKQTEIDFNIQFVRHISRPPAPAPFISTSEPSVYHRRTFSEKPKKEPATTLFNMSGTTQDFLSFISGCPTPFHVVNNSANLLKEAGFTQVKTKAPTDVLIC